MIAFNVSDASCTSQAGLNVYMANYYMLHVWVIDDMKFIPDVYAGMIPCIANGTAVHDPNASCHVSRTGGATATAALGGKSAVARASTLGTEPKTFICFGET